eukprot:2157943-Amphidinium_carterae.1
MCNTTNYRQHRSINENIFISYIKLINTRKRTDHFPRSAKANEAVQQKVHGEEPCGSNGSLVTTEQCQAIADELDPTDTARGLRSWWSALQDRLLTKGTSIPRVGHTYWLHPILGTMSSKPQPIAVHSDLIHLPRRDKNRTPTKKTQNNMKQSQSHCGKCYHVANDYVNTIIVKHWLTVGKYVMTII